MVLDLGKVEEQAPHLVDLCKGVGLVLAKNNIDPSKYKAAVVAAFDRSPSTEMGGNRLYSSGEMQRLADMALVAGLHFDDDGKEPIAVFGDRVRELGEATIENCKGYLDKHVGDLINGTHYTAPLRWIIEQAGYDPDTLEPASGSSNSGGGRGLFRRRRDVSTMAQPKPNLNAYPTFGIVGTDGEPQDERETSRLIVAMREKKLPIFVQFVGVGRETFSVLKDLQRLGVGKEINNVGFFDSKDARGDENRMLELLLGDFAVYYKRALELGHVTG